MGGGSICRALAVAGLILSAAACSQPDYTTERGIAVYDPEGLSSREAVEEVVDVWVESSGFNEEHLDGSELVLVAQPIWLEGARIPATGSYSAHTMTVQVGEGCLAESSLVHEMAHLAQDWAEGKVEEFHESPAYWHPSRGYAAKAMVAAADLCRSAIDLPGQSQTQR